MEHLPPSVNKASSDSLDPEVELIASPPSDQAIVEDTANVGADSERSKTAEFATAAHDATTIRGLRIRREQIEFHSGPFPPSKDLREYAEIYPPAPRLIFEDFHAQSAHRREIEKSVIETKNTLAMRGQIIAGVLGGIGLIGSLVIAGMGQGWAGFGIAMGSVGSLVSVFIYGREDQKKERIDKEKVREQIKRGTSIEKPEDANPSADHGGKGGT